MSEDIEKLKKEFHELVHFIGTEYKKVINHIEHITAFTRILSKRQDNLERLMKEVSHGAIYDDRLLVPEREIYQVKDRLDRIERCLHYKEDINDDSKLNLWEIDFLNESDWSATSREDILYMRVIFTKLLTINPDLLKDFDKREDFIFRERVLSINRQSYTQLGEKFGVSRNRVNQIYKKSVRKLRFQMREMLKA